MRPRPRHATVHVRRTEKSRARNPLAIQGRRSRRDTNELRASSAHVRPIYLRTLQRVDFTNFLPCWRERTACGDPGSDSNAGFFRRERFASLKRYVRARREPRETVPMTFVSRLSVVTAYVAFAFVGAIVLGVI